MVYVVNDFACQESDLKREFISARACLDNKQSPGIYHFITMMMKMRSWKKGHLL